MSLTIKELIEKSHNCAVSKGWWEDENRVPVSVDVMEKLCLVHSEVSEATEDFRNGIMEMRYEYKEEAVDSGRFVRVMDHNPGPHTKPVGFPSELADILIRVADLAGALNIDLEKALLEKMAYNATRPYRHGGKRA
jgi:hypothetical protein